MIEFDAKRSRVAVATIFAINGFLYANWVARLPRLQESYGLDHGQLGLALLAASVGALVAMPLTGKVIVQAGSHRITRIMLLSFCVLIPFIPVTPNIYTLAGVLFLIGASTGSLDVAMNAQAVLVEQALRKPVMSSFHAIFSAGMMMGAGSGALFNRLEIGLPQHLLVVSVIGVLAAIWAQGLLIPDHRDVTEEEAGNSTNILLRPELLILGLIAFCCMLGEGAMADWTTNYLEKVSNGGRYWSPFGLVAFSTAMMVGRFLGDGARIKIGDAKLLLVGSFIAVGGMLMALIWSVIWTGIGGFFLVGLGLATIVPIAYSRAGSLPDLSPGVGISMVTTIGYAGFLVGPPAIGFISDWLDLRWGMGFVLFLFALMLLLNWVAIRQERAKTARELELESELEYESK